MNFLKLYHQSDNIDPLHVKALNCAYVMFSENNGNSSTSASRITVSTKSDFYSGLIAGIGVFKGSIHGAALS